MLISSRNTHISGGNMAETPNLNSLYARLEKLERQNRRMRRIGIAVFVLVVAVVTLGQTHSSSPTVIEANEFRLTDAAGKVRGELSANSDSATFKLSDAQGHPTAMLSSTVDATYLWLMPPHSTSQVFLAAGPKAGMLVDGGAGRLRLRADLDEASPKDSPGPSFIVEDNDGYSATIGRSNIMTSKPGQEKNATPAASLVLLDMHKKVLWSAP
jgi:hypothetical protein